MASHTTETQGTRQSVFAPRRDKCATSTSVWFAYVGTQAQSNGHSQGLVTQSQATGSDRKRVKPVSGVLSCKGPPSGLGMFFLVWVGFVFIVCELEILFLCCSQVPPATSPIVSPCLGLDGYQALLGGLTGVRGCPRLMPKRRKAPAMTPFVSPVLQFQWKK